jgi:hypothetical protein
MSALARRIFAETTHAETTHKLPRQQDLTVFDELNLKFSARQKMG